VLEFGSRAPLKELESDTDTEPDPDPDPELILILILSLILKLSLRGGPYGFELAGTDHVGWNERQQLGGERRGCVLGVRRFNSGY